MAGEKLTILMDMDGVLADFMTSAITAHGKEHLCSHDDVTSWNWFLEQWEMDPSDFWEPIDADPRFWLDLKPYPWIDDLNKVLRLGLAGRNWEKLYCTTPSANHASLSGKHQWLENQFLSGDGDEDLITIHDKSRLAGPNVILIDDREENVDRFRKAGGRAILFPQPWNRSWDDLGTRRMKSVELQLLTILACLDAEPEPEPEPEPETTPQDMGARSFVCREAERLTCQDRNKDYGDPNADFARIADLWTTLLSTKLQDGVRLETWEVAMFMACVKLSRMVERPGKADNWVDLAGYAACGAHCAATGVEGPHDFPEFTVPLIESAC